MSDFGTPNSFARRRFFPPSKLWYDCLEADVTTLRQLQGKRSAYS